MNQLFRRLNAFAVNLAGLAEAEGRVALHVGGRVLRVLTWWSIAVSLASMAGLVLTVAFMWLLAEIIGWPLALLLAGIWLAVAAAGAAWMGLRSAMPPPPAAPPPASAAGVYPGSPAAPPVPPASATPRTVVPSGPTPPRSAVS